MRLNRWISGSSFLEGKLRQQITEIIKIRRPKKARALHHRCRLEGQPVTPSRMLLHCSGRSAHTGRRGSASGRVVAKLLRPLDTCTGHSVTLHAPHSTTRWERCKIGWVPMFSAKTTGPSVGTSSTVERHSIHAMLSERKVQTQHRHHARRNEGRYEFAH